MFQNVEKFIPSKLKETIFFNYSLICFLLFKNSILKKH